MTKRRKKNKNPIKISAVTLLILIAVAVSYLVYDNYFREKEKSNDPQPTPAVVENNPDKGGKGGTVEPEPATDPEPVKKDVVQYEGNDPNEAEALTGVLTHASVSGENLVLRVNIDQYLSDGRCVLKLYNNGTVAYTDEVDTIDAASTSTCEGFNVPISGMASGKYDIEISIHADGKSGTINGRVSW